MNERPLQLMLVDADPVFRLGLKVWLEQQGDFTVVAEAGGATEALSDVRSRFQAYQQSLDDPALRPKNAAIKAPIDLIILDLGLGAQDPDSVPGLQLCQQIKTDFPQLPVLVLSAQAEPVLQAAAERMGANGYGTRSMSVRRLAQLIRQVAASPLSSSASSQAVAGAPPADASGPLPGGGVSSAPGSTAAAGSQQGGRRSSRQPSSAASLSRLNDIPGPLTAMRISMRLSGLQQIDQNINAVNLARQQTSSWFNQAILSGRKRELAAARWLVASLWRTPRFEDGPTRGGRSPQRSGGLSASSDWMRIAQQGGYGSNYADMTAARYLDRNSVAASAAEALGTKASRSR
ncbi:MAG: response regulator transcription factor [Cyanobacteria bacterium J06597_16]